MKRITTIIGLLELQLDQDSLPIKAVILSIAWGTKNELMELQVYGTGILWVRVQAWGPQFWGIDTVLFGWPGEPWVHVLREQLKLNWTLIIIEVVVFEANA